MEAAKRKKTVKNPHREQHRVQRPGYELVLIEKRPDEIKCEARAFAKLCRLPEYARIEVTDCSVASPVGRVFELASVPALVRAMHSLRSVHGCGVVHADLKEDHVLQLPDGTLFFIDFAYAVFRPGAASIGLSYFYASLTTLLERVVHPLDDYEALLMAALSFLDFQFEDAHLNTLPKTKKRYVPLLFPDHPHGDVPRERWVEWKRQLVAFVLTRLRASAGAGADDEPLDKSLDSTPLDKAPEEVTRLVQACYRTLMMVWEMPRKHKWLTDLDHEAIVRCLEL
jgi:hypothetical protein